MSERTAGEDSGGHKKIKTDPKTFVNCLLSKHNITDCDEKEISEMVSKSLKVDAKDVEFQQVFVNHDKESTNCSSVAFEENESQSNDNDDSSEAGSEFTPFQDTASLGNDSGVSWSREESTSGQLTTLSF